MGYLSVQTITTSRCPGVDVILHAHQVKKNKTKNLKKDLMCRRAVHIVFFFLTLPHAHNAAAMCRCKGRIKNTQHIAVRTAWPYV